MISIHIIRIAIYDDFIHISDKICLIIYEVLKINCCFNNGKKNVARSCLMFYECLKITFNR